MKEDNIIPYCREAAYYDNKIVWAGSYLSVPTNFDKPALFSKNNSTADSEIYCREVAIFKNRYGWGRLLSVSHKKVQN